MIGYFMGFKLGWHMIGYLDQMFRIIIVVMMISVVLDLWL